MIDVLQKKVDSLLQNYLVFDGEFEAFTPWWGGNEFGYTFYPQPHYPEPKEIIGKTKWTIRTLLGYVPNELGSLKSEASKEGQQQNPPAEAKRLESGASKVKVTVEPLSEGQKYFENVPQVSGKLTEILNCMREYGYSLLFRNFEINEKILEKCKRKYGLPLLPQFNGLYKLLTIPRFYLRAMGAKNLRELLFFQPMRPGFGIRIRVYSKEKNLAKLFVLSMLITLKYLGIGSAANRGFGRFKLVKINTTTIEEIKDNMDIYNLLKILNYEKSQPKILNYYEKKQKPCFPRFPYQNEIKKIDKVCAEINRKKYQANSIEGVLAAIGLATLKSTWKSHCNELKKSGKEYNELKKSGKEYHTWVLGLPRSVKGKGYEAKIIMGNKEESISRRQSYIVISPTETNGVILLPFYASDYPSYDNKTIVISHKDHGSSNVAKLGVKESSCSSLRNQHLTIDEYINITLDWLEELLSC